LAGNAIALNGRDCSVQRRFQKIVEEGPPIAAKPEIWPMMEKAAIALAQEVSEPWPRRCLGPKGHCTRGGCNSVVVVYLTNTRTGDDTLNF
jgi:hypothetical protein